MHICLFIYMHENSPSFFSFSCFLPHTKGCSRFESPKGLISLEYPNTFAIYICQHDNINTIGPSDWQYFFKWYVCHSVPSPLSCDSSSDSSSPCPLHQRSAASSYSWESQPELISDENDSIIFNNILSTNEDNNSERFSLLFIFLFLLLLIRLAHFYVLMTELSGSLTDYVICK